MKKYISMTEAVAKTSAAHYSHNDDPRGREDAARKRIARAVEAGQLKKHADKFIETEFTAWADAQRFRRQVRGHRGITAEAGHYTLTGHDAATLPTSRTELVSRCLQAERELRECRKELQAAKVELVELRAYKADRTTRDDRARATRVAAAKKK